MPCFSAKNIGYHSENTLIPSRVNMGELETMQQYGSAIPRQRLQFSCDQRRVTQITKKFPRAATAQQQKSRYQENAAFVPKTEWSRLKNASKVFSLEDRLDALLQQEQETNRLREEAEKQKQRFREMDEARLKARNAASSADNDDFFGEEKVKILEHAFLAKHEQEEEVRRVNRIILNAKCHAIRDAQIQEKHELTKEQKDEEIRLGKLMVDRAKRELEADDEEVIRQQEKKQHYANQIKHQLNEREKLRFMETLRIEDEAKMQAKASEALKREDERLAQLAHERRQKLRQELSRICEMSALFKKMIFEQEKEAEMRIHAYMKERDERQRQLALERKLAKEALERKKDRLFNLQKKMIESKTTREEMALIREQENIEREYRRKEKEAAIKQRQFIKEILKARDEQLNSTKRQQAFEVARSEEEFRKTVERLRTEEAKQKLMDEERRRNRDRYRSDIIRQMTDKEKERRKIMEKDQTEALAWRERERMREQNVRTVIKKKLDEMRNALPEKYVKDVEHLMAKVSIEQKRKGAVI